MPPKKAPKATPALQPPDEEEPTPATPTFTDDQRRERVARVRGTDAELAQIENVLLDVKARLPALLGDVQRVRRVIAENTAPARPSD